MSRVATRSWWDEFERTLAAIASGCGSAVTTCEREPLRTPSRSPRSSSDAPSLRPSAYTPGMSWKPELDEISRREALAREMGGAERVQRQHDAGRLTVRERIDRLLDARSFHETGALTGRPEYDGDRLVGIRPSNFVMGNGSPRRSAGKS